MTLITQDIGLGFISPRPRARIELTITRDALAATNKEQKIEHTCIKALKIQLDYIYNQPLKLNGHWPKHSLNK